MLSSLYSFWTLARTCHESWPLHQNFSLQVTRSPEKLHLFPWLNRLLYIIHREIPWLIPISQWSHTSKSLLELYDSYCVRQRSVDALKLYEWLINWCLHELMWLMLQIFLAETYCMLLSWHYICSHSFLHYSRCKPVG